MEFYAPWCGHCQNLKPAYEKAAKNLDGLAKVAAIDCDDDINKAFCGNMGVKGFPTLKIVRPAKKGGHPIVEDYQGQRATKNIVDAVMRSINNHVLRVTDNDVDSFLSGDKPKAILFSEKGTTSALLRALAIDFLDVISFGQVRENQKETVKKYGIEKFPTLVLFNGGDEPIVYDGELTKKDMLEFLSQAGQPNVDGAAAKGKEKAKSKTEKKSEKKPKAEKKSKKPAKSAEEEKTAEPEVKEETATEEPVQNAAPSDIPIKTLTTHEELADHCLKKTSHTCVLVFTPAKDSETGDKAVSSLSHLNTKYLQGKRHLFPFFSIPSDSEAASTLPKALELDGEVNMIAVNARRAWWRQYSGDFSLESVESWIDAIRMGEGSKKKLPKDLLSEVTESSSSASTEEASEATQATDPEPEIETEAVPEAEAETVVPEAPVEDETTSAEAEAETASPVPEPEAEPEPEASEVEEETAPTGAAEPEPEVETEAPATPKAEETKKEETIKHEEL